MYNNIRSLRLLVLVCVIVFLDIIMLPVAFAEDLMEVYKLAEEQDAAYQAAHFQLKAVEEDVPQARAGLLPSISLQASKTKTRQSIRESENPFVETGDSKVESANRSISLTIPLLNYRSWVRYNQANLAVQQARTEFAVAYQELILNVAEAYFTTLAAKDQLEFARVEKNAIGKQLRDVKSRQKAGAARIADVLDAEARYALAESKEIEAQNALEDSQQSMREHTKVFVLDVSPLIKDFPLIPPTPNDVKVWIDEAMSNNVSLAASRLFLEVSRQEIKLSGAGHYPTLDLVLSKNRSITGEGTYGGTAGIVDNGNTMLQFRLPIYEGGGTQSKMRQAFLRKEKADRDMEDMQRKVVHETQTAFRGVLSGIKKVQALKQSILSQKNALKMKRKGLEAGVNTLLEVLDAQRELTFAQTNFSRSRYDYLLSVLKLKRAAGKLIASDLMELNELVR